jgi:hypothetical protein
VAGECIVRIIFLADIRQLKGLSSFQRPNHVFKVGLESTTGHTSKEKGWTWLVFQGLKDWVHRKVVGSSVPKGSPMRKHVGAGRIQPALFLQHLPADLLRNAKANTRKRRRCSFGSLDIAEAVGLVFPARTIGKVSHRIQGRERLCNKSPPK